MPEEAGRPKQLNGAEALMGFLAWLTSRDEPVTLSATHNATVAVQLFDAFAACNTLGELGEDWPECVTRPPPLTLFGEDGAGWAIRPPIITLYTRDVE